MVSQLPLDVAGIVSVWLEVSNTPRALQEGLIYLGRSLFYTV